VAQFFKILGVFRRFDGLSSLSGSNPMAKHPEINEDNPHKSPKKSLKDWGLLGLMLASKTLESRSMTPKTGIIS